MHETGIVRNLIQKLEKAAREADAVRIAAVEIRIGALAQFSAAHFREHFEEEARGTLAEDAALRIELSEDVRDAHAQDVTIVSIDLEVPDGSGAAP